MIERSGTEASATTFLVLELNIRCLSLYTIKYITGTSTSVRNVPKIKPKIIVHDNGAQKV